MVSIDAVYQKVLAIANKEKRGYITPQEFNLFADQVQMEIFEQYFYDLQRHEQRVTDGSVSELIQSKIEYFKSATTNISHGNTLPADCYRVEAVSIQEQGTSTYWGGWASHLVEKIDRDESNRFHFNLTGLPLLTPNLRRPIYSIVGEKIILDPADGTYRINYIKKPKKPMWTYMMGGGENALYNPNALDHQDFELHASEEPNLVNRILVYAGIAIQKPEITQIAAGIQSQKIQQENQ